MPNMDFYTYMHNHKVLHGKPNETGLITATAVIKILIIYHIVVKQNA